MAHGLGAPRHVGSPADCISTNVLYYSLFFQVLSNKNLLNSQIVKNNQGYISVIEYNYKIKFNIALNTI